MAIKLAVYLYFYSVFLCMPKYAVSTVQGNIVDRLNTMFTPPDKWKTFDDVKIIQNGSIKTVDDLLKPTDINVPAVTADNFDERLGQISALVSCKYSSKLKEFVALIKGAIADCLKKKGDVLSLLNCTQQILNKIYGTGPMVVHMLSALLYLNDLSPGNTVNRKVYDALMSLKMFSSNVIKISQTLVDADNVIDQTNIFKALNTSNRTLSLVDSRIQEFSIEYCYPVNNDLQLNTVNSVCKTHNMNSSDQITLTECLLDVVDKLVKNVVDDFNTALGFDFYMEASTSTTLSDLSLMWQSIESQRITKLPTTLQWSNDTKDLRAVVEQVRSQYSTVDLAAFQKMSLKANVEILYRLTLNAVEVFCDRPRPVHDKINLKTNSFWRALRERLLKTGFISLQPFEANTDLDEPSTEEKFWTDLKKILHKLHVVVFPSDAELILGFIDDTVTEVVDTKMFNNACKIVRESLNIELTTTVVSFDPDRTKISGGTEVQLEFLNGFIDKVIKIRHSMETVTRSNALLWNAAYSKQTATDDSAQVQNVCDLSFRIVEVFVIMKSIANKCFTMPRARNQCFLRIYRVADDLRSNIKLIAARALNVENVNVRNALVLIFLYLNNVGSEPRRISARTAQNDYLEKYCLKNSYWLQISRFKNLHLLIISQLFKYMTSSCSNYEYNSVAKEPKFMMSTRDPFVLRCKEILTSLSTQKITGLASECVFDLSYASFERLVGGARDADGSLAWIDQLKFTCDGTLKNLETIRQEVIHDVNPIPFAKYQNQVICAVTSIVFVYIYIIMEATKSGVSRVNENEIDFIVSKLDKFDQTVNPVSQYNSPKHIYKLFGLYLKNLPFSQYTTPTILKSIETYLKSYGIDLSSWFQVISEKTSMLKDDQDLFEPFIKSLHNYVFAELDKFKNDFDCVAQYMSLNFL